MWFLKLGILDQLVLEVQKVRASGGIAAELWAGAVVI